MTNDTLKSYYAKSIETFEFAEVNGEAFWATVTLILAEEGHIEKEDFADVMQLLSHLPAYASNMQKQMQTMELLSTKKKAESLAAKYTAKVNAAQA
mgnify:CR=1 FL=1